MLFMHHAMSVVGAFSLSTSPSGRRLWIKSRKECCVKHRDELQSEGFLCIRGGGGRRAHGTIVHPLLHTLSISHATLCLWQIPKNCNRSTAAFFAVYHKDKSSPKSINFSNLSFFFVFTFAELCSVVSDAHVFPLHNVLLKLLFI